MRNSVIKSRKAIQTNIIAFGPKVEVYTFKDHIITIFSFFKNNCLMAINHSMERPLKQDIKRINTS